MKTCTPVVGTAKIIIISARKLGIKLSHAHPSEYPIVCADNLALVILCAHVAVIASSTKLWNADAHAEISEIRLYCLAEAGTLVAHSKVVVIVPTTGRPGLARYRDTAQLIAVAAARHVNDDESIIIACKAVAFVQCRWRSEH
jgi:hypothetical protein